MTALPIAYGVPCTHKCGPAWHGLIYLAVLAAVVLVVIARAGYFGQLRHRIRHVGHSPHRNKHHPSTGAGRRHH
ncbi:hypothetical protein HC031_20680 [Planosporangium thailandense]|uniref:Uncharacterized protein n=1 Tax=Planosporangium thailandense TaxID=765197 RepID=A0ABX0Y3W4_9ACTN|nr:hypothetical protein [Planosporangium thailandense]NJC72113.1 hypothetical protein [Planosporangium thailandense]